MFLSSGLFRSSRLISDFIQGSNAPRPTDDPRDPPCTVHLYVRPIIDDEKNAPTMAQHWLLLFDWGYYKCTVDANCVDGILTPFIRDGKPEDLEDAQFCRKELIRDLKISPSAVEEKAKENKYSGKSYSVLSTNCQVWVRELGRLLGITLPSDQVEESLDMMEGIRDPVHMMLKLLTKGRGFETVSRQPN